MEWQQLVYFRCVAQTEHMGEAAELLHISQPALSMSIKSLENELGVPLFDRVKKNISLNSYGVVFLGYVERALNEIDNGKKEISELKNRNDRHVSIMCPPTFMSMELMDYLYKRSADVFIENRPVDFSKAKSNIISGSLDFTVIAPMIEGSHIANIPLKTQTIGIAMNKSNPLARFERLHLSDLSNCYFSAYPVNTSPRIHFENCCRAAGFAPKVIYEAVGAHDILNPVRADRAISFLVSDPDILYEHEDLVIIPLAEDDKISVTFGISYCNDRPVRPAAKILMDVIVDYFKSIKVSPNQ